MDTKTCVRCGAPYTKKKGVTNALFAASFYCSRKCHNENQRERAEAKLVTKVCEGCGEEFRRPRRYPDALWADRKYCSQKCAHADQSRYMRGEDHPSWRGGRVVHDQGYVMVRVDGRYVMEHRLVMERELGRPLRRNETIHHINGDRSDNRLENLQLHSGRHGKGSKRVCLDCGSENIGEVPLQITWTWTLTPS